MADAIYQPGPLIPVLDPNDDIVRVDQLTGTTFRFTFPNDKQWTFTLPPGAPGFPGTNGVTPTFTVGKVTSLPPGGIATVVVRSTDQPNRYALDFQLPTGPVGPAPSVVAGSTTTGQLAASVTPTGNPNEYAINLVLPQTPGTGNVNGTASTLDTEIMVADGAGTTKVKGSGKRIMDLAIGEPIVPVTAARTLSASDAYKLLVCSGGPFAITGNPATLGAGWWVDIKNVLPGAITLSPSSGAVDGLTGIRIYEESIRLLSDGTNFYTQGRDKRVLVQRLAITSAVSSFTLSGLTDQEIGDYELRYRNLVSAASGVYIQLVAGGSTLTDNHIGQIIGYGSSSGTSGVQSTGAAFAIDTNTGSGTFARNGLINLLNTRSGPSGANVQGQSHIRTPANQPVGFNFWGYNNSSSTTPIDGLILSFNGQTATAGSFQVYGLRG